ncbi:TetR family transcriptional regulator [Gracilibacillus sp. JCM 18860]|uniref:TetR family transcriptional regulator n=1 Tax=Gracilibacillus sp. JCM 18860 TaxID=1306159 RepID=UPI0006D0B9F8
MSKKTRTKIIEAAHQLFIQKGFDATSIQDILDKAGISKGTFYNYFQSKNDCLIAIISVVREEIIDKRRELAFGKDKADEEVFIQQIAIRINMNRQHHLMTVFETVSFSEDKELKEHITNAHQGEIRWIAKRLEDLYPSEGHPYTLDHAIMLIGITHPMLYAARLGVDEHITTETIIRYAMRRLRSMLDEQISQKDLFFPKDWFVQTDVKEKQEQEHILKNRLVALQKVVKEEKERQYLSFLLKEIQEDEPRHFLLESVSASLEQLAIGMTYEHKVKQAVQWMARRFHW